MQQGRVWNLAELMSLQNDRLDASAVSAGPENFEFFKQIRYLYARETEVCEVSANVPWL